MLMEGGCDESWLGDKLGAAGEFVGRATGDLATIGGRLVGKAVRGAANKVGGYLSKKADNREIEDESWLGDKAKAGWDKVKAGAKKVSKAIGDAFKGPFRKGDHIVMKGEDGEEFKGTIKSFDLGDKTYEVMLGNPVNEDLQDEVLEMPDRVNELD
jgi:hypothetical protein